MTRAGGYIVFTLIATGAEKLGDLVKLAEPEAADKWKSGGVSRMVDAGRLEQT